MLRLNSTTPNASFLLPIGLGAALFLAGCGDDGDDGEPPPPPEATTLEKATDFLGGEAALQATTGFRYQASGTRSAASETYEVGAPAEQLSSFTITVSHDLAGDKIRNDYVRTVDFLGGAEFTFSEIIDGQVGHIEGIESLFGTGDAPMLSTRWAAIREQHDLLNPHLLVLRALNDPQSVTELDDQDLGGVLHEVIELTDAVAPIRLFVDAESGEIARLETMANEFMLRDVAIEVDYGQWSAAGALMFPNEVTMSVHGEVAQAETRSSVEVDPAFDTAIFDIPAGSDPMYVAEDAAFGEINHVFFHEFSALGIPLDFRQEFVQMTEIAAGVFHVTGGSHNSLVIEQENGLVVAEAPNYPERSDAILAELAVMFPGKPVTHVIVTHHHFDHAAGLRSFVAAGATVVTHALAESFYTDVFAAPSTVSPDALVANPMAPVFSTVAQAGSELLDDAVNPVQVFDLTNSHANDMLLIVAGSPDGDVAFESDLYSPGNGGQSLAPMFAMELLASVQDTGLTIAQIAGGHAGVAPLTELEAFVAGL